MKTLLCVLLLSVVEWGQSLLPPPGNAWWYSSTGRSFINSYKGMPEYELWIKWELLIPILDDLPLSDRRVRELMPLVEPLPARDEWVQDGHGRWHHTCKAGYYRDTQDGACHESLVVPGFHCDHNSIYSCASQANGDYGPGRSGLVGEMAPIREDHPCYGHLLPDGTCRVDTPKFGHTGCSSCTQASFGTSAPISVAQEPMDVPAIYARGSKTIYHFKGGVLVDGAFSECHGELKWSLFDKNELQCIELPRWSCSDKSRILLTDEAGGKHCIKF